MTQEFTTDLKCEGCISKVKPILDAEEGIEKWEVNLGSKDKVLSVSGTFDSQRIIDLLKGVGYKAEKRSNFFKKIFG